VIVFVGICFVATLGDLLSKHYVFNSMLAEDALRSRLGTPRGETGSPEAARLVLGRFQRRVCPGVKFTLSTNPGVVFGLTMPRVLVAVATTFAAGMVLYFFCTADASDRLLHVALGLILGGAVGNFYDRAFSNVTVPGYAPIIYQVRDFIDCSEIGYKWIFNIADALLVIGVALVLLHGLMVSRRAATRTGASVKK